MEKSDEDAEAFRSLSSPATHLEGRTVGHYIDGDNCNLTIVKQEDNGPLRLIMSSRLLIGHTRSSASRLSRSHVQMTRKEEADEQHHVDTSTARIEASNGAI